MITLQTQNKEEYKQTELGELPKSWDVVKVKDVSKKLKAGGTPSRGKKEYWNGEIPFVLIEDITATKLYLTQTKEKITQKGLENSNAWVVPENSILLSMYATIGSTAINKIKLATNQAILAIIPKDNFDVLYGAYVLRFNAERLKSYNIATTQKNVNKGIVENFLIPLPPLPEQQKIAYVLSTVQTAQEKTEDYINSLKELKKSAMKHLFTYGAVKFEDVDKIGLKETEIGRIPKEWEVVRLGDVFEISKKPKIQLKKNDKIPFIAMENISDKNEKASYILKEFSKVSSGVFVLKNDLIISKITPCFENGKQAILDNLPLDFGIATTEVIPLHPKNNLKATVYHLYNYIKIAEIRQKLISKMEGTTGRKRLSKHVLNNFQIPLPPLPEQQRIASILSAIDEKIQAEEKKKEALKETFNSLLRDLMTAKIRVNNLEVQE